MSEPPPRGRNLFSLKWKIGLIVTFVLLVVNAVLTYFAYQQSNEQFHQQRFALLQQQQRTISGLLQRDYEQLISFASFIPSLSAGNRHLGGAEQLRAILSRHSALLGLEWGIESVSFVDDKGIVRHSWPDRAGAKGHGELAQLALREDAPARRIDCEQDCVLTLAVPQLEGALRNGVLVISRSVADGVVEFHRLSGSEVAVLVDKRPGGVAPSQRYLSAWQRQVPALSNPQLTFGVLQALQDRHPISAMEQGAVFVDFQNRWYASLLAHHEGAGSNFAFVVISPVNEDLAQLRADNRVLLTTSLAGLLSTAAILLLFLWKPMNRIRRIVTALPALGRSDFPALQATLPEYRDDLFRDEIDIVVESVHQLSDDLELALAARNEAQQSLVWLADHDPLTNLFNRRRFQEVFDQILAMSVRYQRTGALLFLDLDQFKYVNDLSGHQAGDALLLLVASTLRDAVRHSDILARLGGDEFALVLPEGGAADAAYIANKLQHDLSQVDFSSNGRTHKISCSIGITLFPDHGSNLNDLLANADMAMYQAKEAGGARWHQYSPDEQAKELLASRAKWRERISFALIRDAFELHYQPIFDIAANRITRFETLVRMRDNTGALVFPDNFIPIAEESGQIREIDRWVIRNAIAQVRRHQGLSLSVNLSGRVLDDPSLLDWFHQQLQQSRIDPALLVVEITETAAVANVQDAIEFMGSIKALGCRFALDDFGSGFSSFAYLKQLPVDIVKIDGAFIQNLATSSQDQLFVKALTDVAKGLGKVTVAEFVEDKETLDLLREFGVDFAQGYYIGRPSPHLRFVR